MPKEGDVDYDPVTGQSFVYAAGHWVLAYNPVNLKRVSNNSFLCRPCQFSHNINSKIQELGLNSVKRIRKFGEPFYIVEDPAELGIFILYFSDFIT